MSKKLLAVPDAGLLCLVLVGLAVIPLGTCYPLPTRNQPHLTRRDWEKYADQLNSQNFEREPGVMIAADEYRSETHPSKVSEYGNPMSYEERFESMGKEMYRSEAAKPVGIQNRFLDHYFGETGMKNEEVDKEEVDKQVNGKLLLKYANMLGREYDDDDVKPQVSEYGKPMSYEQRLELMGRGMSEAAKPVGIKNRFLGYFGETGMKNEEVDKEEVDKEVNGKLLLKYANMLNGEYDEDDDKPQVSDHEKQLHYENMLKMMEEGEEPEPKMEEPAVDHRDLIGFGDELRKLFSDEVEHNGNGRTANGPMWLGKRSPVMGKRDAPALKE